MEPPGIPGRFTLLEDALLCSEHLGQLGANHQSLDTFIDVFNNAEPLPCFAAMDRRHNLTNKMQSIRPYWEGSAR